MSPCPRGRGSAHAQSSPHRHGEWEGIARRTFDQNEIIGACGIQSIQSTSQITQITCQTHAKRFPITRKAW